MTKRFWIGLILSIPVVALEMGGHLTDLLILVGQSLSNWLQLALASPVVLWAGWPFFVRGWRLVLTCNVESAMPLELCSLAHIWNYTLGKFEDICLISCGCFRQGHLTDSKSVIQSN